MQFNVESPVAHTQAGALGAPSARGAQAIVAEVVSPAGFSTLRSAWDNLVARAAEPNAFMDPALIAAAAHADPDISIRVLLAWQPGADARRLVGAWALALERRRAGVAGRYSSRFMKAPASGSRRK